jgi:DNA-binding transcriptional MerR regulator
MDDNPEESLLLKPGAAASRLGISGSALRRLAVTYEELHGALPEAAGGGRLFSTEAVERLRDARALMSAGRARSVRDALEALMSGAQVSVDAPAVLSRDTQVLEVIARRLEVAERLEMKVEELQREVAELRALPSPVPAGGTASEVKVVEPQRSEQAKWIQDVTTDEAIGVRKIRLDGALVQLARRIERLLGRR